MSADYHQQIYTLPRLSKSLYHRWMKTLTTAAICDAHDAVAFRLKVIMHATGFGWKSAISAFGISKTTLYRWKKKYTVGHHKLAFLIPTSTRPEHLRTMRTDTRLRDFIGAFRIQYGNKSKYIIKPFLDAYARSLGISSLGTTTIGKIIKRHHFVITPKRRWSRKRLTAFQRIKHAPKEHLPGYLEVDCILVYSGGSRHAFVSVIDVVTKMAHIELVPSTTAANTQQVLQMFIGLGYPVREVQTDNGSEFLGVFHDWLVNHDIPHHFIYPHSPRINGVVERFNRTVQEECFNLTDELVTNIPKFKEKLANYMEWYNTRRPHHSLKLMTPLAYYQQLQNFPKCM